MWVILTYDVGAKRNSKVLKVCRKYLVHMQKSVFEGDISEQNLKRMKNEIDRVIDSNSDQVAIYVFDTLRYTRKDIIGYQMFSGSIL